MSKGIKFEINIPADNEGFVLLKCPLCGSLFKLKVEDIEDDGVFDIYCPSCGLVSDNYITEDVVELAEIMASNYIEDVLMKEFKKLEQKTKNSMVKFKVEGNLKKEKEHPIKLTIEALEKKEYICCKKEVKIKPLLKMCSSYCPICGVKDYGTE